MLVVFGLFTVTLFLLTYPRGRSRPAPSTRPRSSRSSASSPATRSAGRSTSRDYRRYMSPDVPVRSTFNWTTGLGHRRRLDDGRRHRAAHGSPPTSSGTGIAEIKSAGDHLFGGFGSVVLLSCRRSGSSRSWPSTCTAGSHHPHQRPRLFQAVRPTLSIRAVTVALTPPCCRSSAPSPRRATSSTASSSSSTSSSTSSSPGPRSTSSTSRRAPRPLRDHRDLQARRDLRPLGLARDHLLPRRLRRHAPLHERREPLHRVRREGDGRRRPVVLRRPARRRDRLLDLSSAASTSSPSGGSPRPRTSHLQDAAHAHVEP